MKKKKNNVVVSGNTEQSNSGDLNTTDYKKIMKGALIAGGGAFLFALITWLSIGLSANDFSWSVLYKTFLTAGVPAALSVGINAILKYVSGPKA